MKVKERLLEELDELEGSDLLRIYDNVLRIKSDKKSRRSEKNGKKPYVECQEALSECKGNLSDDIIENRKERI